LQRLVNVKANVVSIAGRERASGFRGLAGSRLEAAVPVTQRLVEVLVGQVAARRNLHGLTVALRDDQEIEITIVKSVLGFETRLAVDLRIRGPVDLATDPRLYLLVARPSFTWSAISRLVVAAGLAPAGVEIARDGVAIDLRVLASRAGVADLLSLVRTIAFEGEAGVLRVHVAADVPEGGGIPADAPAPRPPDPAPNSPRGGVSPVAVATLLTEIRGARVRGRLAISQDLANEAIGLALETARQGPRADAVQADGPVATPRTPVDAATVARWVQGTTVRFEIGRVVLEPDVVIG
jgi:hypothetical protein